jgi:ABC-type phosphate transport system permease subunit
MFKFIEIAYATPTMPGESTPGASSIGDYNTLLNNILKNIVNPIITLMVAIAVIYFLWGVFNFVRNAESSEERKKGGTHMLFGALGFFIMVSAYGILNLILGTIK